MTEEATSRDCFLFVTEGDLLERVRADHQAEVNQACQRNKTRRDEGFFFFPPCVVEHTASLCQLKASHVPWCCVGDISKKKTWG